MIPEPGSATFGESGEYELGFLVPLISGLGGIVAAVAPAAAAVQSIFPNIFGGGGGLASPDMSQGGCDFGAAGW